MIYTSIYSFVNNDKKVVQLLSCYIQGKYANLSLEKKTADLERLRIFILITTLIGDSFNLDLLQ